MTTASHPLVGALVDGRYRVLGHLADGGMATVLLATDTRLDREVALKVMRPDLAADQTFVSRFRREARSAARLSHPNVVQVFDQGEDEGRVFLAMEYVEGRSVRELMDDQEGALTPRAALDLMEAVLTGLAVAHEAGYIHRDVKPENILIADNGRVKVADFGLARAVTAQTTTADDGVLYGTVAYLSPEQVERGIADARSDVYAAGLVLYELLTGTRAIEGESPIHIAFQHVHGGVPAPSERVADLPAPLDALVALATHRDPDERPRDAGEYLESLRAARAELTTQQLDRRPAVAAAGTSATATVAHPRPSRTQALGASASAGTPAGPTAAVPVGTADADGTDGGDPPSPRRRRRGLLAVLLAVLLLAAGGLGYWFTAGPGGSVLVPDVSGQTREEAETTLTAADLDLAAERAFSETVPRGAAITSNPQPETEQSKGTTVTVVFSKGPERYEVPDLAGMPLDAAEQALAERHLSVDGTTEQWHESVPKGEIIAVDPGPGTELKRDETVAVTVSKGPEPIPVPDVAGSGLDAATAAIEDAGLTVERAEDVHSTSVPKGSVVTQSPADGTLTRGETVTLTVSKGPEMVTVPTVQGMSEAEARTKLEAAGFSVTVEKVFGAPFDRVTASDPAGGQTAAKGSAVKIYVV